MQFPDKGQLGVRAASGVHLCNTELAAHFARGRFIVSRQHDDRHSGCLQPGDSDAGIGPHLLFEFERCKPALPITQKGLLQGARSMAGKAAKRSRPQAHRCCHAAAIDRHQLALDTLPRQFDHALHPLRRRIL